MTMADPSTKAGKTTGFTVLELLVAMVIFSVLALLVFQMISAARGLSSGERSRMRVLSECRFALDRLGFDLGALHRRPDLGILFEKRTGNDLLCFYAAIPAATGDRRISAVEYRVTEDLLERGARGTDWTPGADLKFNKTDPDIPDEPDFQRIAEGVLRFEIVFLKKSDGLCTNTLPSAEDLAGIVASVAAVDATTMDRLTSEQRDDLRQILGDPDEGKTAVQTWQAAIFGSGGPPSSLPPGVLQALRFYQRTYHFE